MKRAIVITFVLACVFLFASCGDKKHNGENTAKYHKNNGGGSVRDDERKRSRHRRRAHKKRI